MATKTGAEITYGGAAADIGGEVGYLKDGCSITPSFEVYTPDGIEGLCMAPIAWRTKQEITVSFNMLQPTLANFKIAWDIEAAVGAGPDPLPLEVGAGGTDGFVCQQRVVKIFGVVPGADRFVRTWQFDVCVLQSAGEHKISQYGESLLPTTWLVLYDETNSRLALISDAQS